MCHVVLAASTDPQVQLALLETEERCGAFRQQYAKYAHLWEGNMQQALRDFLAASTAASGGGGEGGEGSSSGGSGSGPSLEAFAAEIAKYKALQDEVSALPSSAPIGWIKVDARPIKQVGPGRPMGIWTALLCSCLATFLCPQQTIHSASFAPSPPHAGSAHLGLQVDLPLHEAPPQQCGWEWLEALVGGDGGSCSGGCKTQNSLVFSLLSHSLFSLTAGGGHGAGAVRLHGPGQRHAGREPGGGGPCPGLCARRQPAALGQGHAPQPALGRGTRARLGRN